MKRLLRSCVRYVKDARWIAECMLKDSVCGSFVSPGRIRQLLQYDLLVYNIDFEIIRVLTRPEAAVQQCAESPKYLLEERYTIL